MAKPVKGPLIKKRITRGTNAQSNGCPLRRNGVNRLAADCRWGNVLNDAQVAGIRRIGSVVFILCLLLFVSVISPMNAQLRVGMYHRLGRTIAGT
jgi:hypothetical protein